MVFGALGGAVAGGIGPEQPFGLVRCGRGTCCFVGQDLREAASGGRVLGVVQDLGHGRGDLTRVDRCFSRIPAPRRSTRTVLSFWSLPIGMQISGTPAARDFSTVP